MVAGADRDPFQIEKPADFLGTFVVEDKRKDADFFTSGADQTQAIDSRKSLRAIFEKLMFVLGDIGQTETADVIERGPQSHGIADAGSAGLEAARRIVVNRLL